LSEEDRVYVLDNIDLSGETRLGIGGLSEGMAVPGGARLRSFPTSVRERIPALEDYKYMVYENEVGIVDPHQQIVIDIIPRVR
jgi:hypothetical protein